MATAPKSSSPFDGVHPVTLSPVPDAVGDVDTPDVVDEPAGDELEVTAPASDEPAEWTHETIEFLGDTLQVRKPTQQAMAAFSLATSKYVTPQVRNDMTGMFISRHMSPDSYSQVFSRLMDPDDEDYTVDSIGALMRTIVELASTG